MTTRQTEVYNNLMRLLHDRMNENELNKTLSKIFGREINVEDCTDEEWTGDWYYSFNVDDEEIGGFFDIYFLKMREHDDDEMRFYITEVTCDFENI